MAEVLRDAEAIERLYAERQKQSITVETRDGGSREVVPSDASFTAARIVAVLADHYLAGIECDHEQGRDKAACGCSLVDLGWHPSVGEARSSWIAHVVAELAA